MNKAIVKLKKEIAQRKAWDIYVAKNPDNFPNEKSNRDSLYWTAGMVAALKIIEQEIKEM